MEFQELVKVRRSSRSFEGTSISKVQLSVILDAGCWAPSPLNLQPWEFILISDSQMKKQVRKVAEDAKQAVVEKNGPGWAAGYETSFLEEAAVLVVVLVNPSRGGLGRYFDQAHGAIQAGSACIQNMLLACADIGLGALWFTFFRPETLCAVLNIPESFEIAGIIPIGKPRGALKSVPRKKPKVHRNRFISTPPKQ